jgi:hypothetical protein
MLLGAEIDAAVAHRTVGDAGSAPAAE